MRGGMFYIVLSGCSVGECPQQGKSAEARPGCSVQGVHSHTYCLWDTENTNSGPCPVVLCLGGEIRVWQAHSQCWGLCRTLLDIAGV